MYKAIIFVNFDQIYMQLFSLAQQTYSFNLDISVLGTFISNTTHTTWLELEGPCKRESCSTNKQSRTMTGRIALQCMHGIWDTNLTGMQHFVETELYYWQRPVLKAIWIQKTSQMCNLDCGLLTLNEAWTTHSMRDHPPAVSIFFSFLRSNFMFYLTVTTSSIILADCAVWLHMLCVVLLMKVPKTN